ncbi:hypothetical protein GCM10011335_41670 [Aureimonas glaciei]|uniref:Phosphatidic acid phosphatase type 2/haloperoxidase domain-containing protein n=2 Tax=Aureimonas glaciei TaxID=1776957 RepID=A0A917DFL9_9HYPH|nr:hypothetical protein GCM10011335_41670 [Aureimonas glaciei]
MRGKGLAVSLLVILPVMVWVDTPVAAWVATQQSRQPGSGAAFSNWLALPGAVLAVAAVLAALVAPTRPGRRRPADPAQLPGHTATLVLVSAAASLAAAATLKHLIGRIRPSAGADAWRFEPMAFDDRFAALPSAQAACVAAIVLGLAMRLPRWRMPLFTAGAAACLARVAAGAHWPSDVVAGWGLGAAMVLVTQLGLVRRQRRPGSRRR